MDEKLETTTEPNANEVMDAPMDSLQGSAETAAVSPTIPEPADNITEGDQLDAAAPEIEASVPSPVNFSEINFEESFVNYLRYERNMSPETIRAYEKDLHQFLRFFSQEVTT